MKYLHSYTSTPLAAGATYTSPWVPMLTQPVLPGAVPPAIVMQTVRLQAFAFSDQVSADLGLNLDWSIDGVSVIFSQSSKVLANTVTALDVPVPAPYLRVRYVNGLVDQGVFYLAVYMLDT